jgi:exodeoxyribonuclease V alpha subunit
MLNYKLIPNITLTRIYRQSEDAMITTLAAQVRSGQMPQTDKNYDDFKWHDHSIKDYNLIKNKLSSDALRKLREDNNIGMQQSIIKLAVEAKKEVVSMREHEKWWEFITRFQVVTPQKATVVGVNELNTQLQEVFNPFSGSQLVRSIDKRTFRPGDKVVHLQNQWMRALDQEDLELLMRDDLEQRYSEDKKIRVMNGQLGVVDSVFGNEMTVYFPIEKTLILYTQSVINSGSIDLGYALTVHKTQGSEYRQVVMPVTSSHYGMLTPKLIYTAMTRAKDRLDMVGQREALSAGLSQNDKTRRTCIRSWNEQQQPTPTGTFKRKF